MKLQAELLPLIEKYRAAAGLIVAYAEHLKAAGGYKDFHTRLAWDVLRGIVGTRGICDWYDKYNCHDSHIETLAKRALKEVYTV